MKNEGFFAVPSACDRRPLGFFAPETLGIPISVHFSLPSGFAIATKSGRAAALDEAVSKVNFTRNC